MSAGTTTTHDPTPIHTLGRWTVDFITAIGDLACFTTQMLGWLVTRMPRSQVLWPAMHDVGVMSAPVVLITGLFIGMVLAVQSYDTLRMMHFESRIGSVVNASLVRELGPVLAATMLAGRVGSAIAAEIGTMKVTEQIDALRALGADPISYLVVPRFLACFLLIPMLTLLADGVGMFGGWLVSTQALGVSSFYYWHYSDTFLTAYDIVTGTLKSVFFGSAIALVACHRGFHCTAGAEGVGRAATEAFVYSFVAILALDFVLGIVLIHVYRWWWFVPVTVM